MKDIVGGLVDFFDWSSGRCASNLQQHGLAGLIKNWFLLANAKRYKTVYMKTE